MLGFVIGLIIFVSILIVISVLAQNSKGGAGGPMGGGATSQVFGVSRSGDILEKTTWTLVIILVVLCLSTSFLVDKNGVNENGVPKSVNIDKAIEAGAGAGAGIQQSQPAAKADTTKQN